MSDRRSTFVERVLDGEARIDQLGAAIDGWLAGPQTSPLHEVLGLDADALELVANTPDSLRYLLHARRFGRRVEADQLRSQTRVRNHATQLACAVVNPFDLAELEAWRPRVDAEAEQVRRGAAHA